MTQSEKCMKTVNISLRIICMHRRRRCACAVCVTWQPIDNSFPACYGACALHRFRQPVRYSFRSDVSQMRRAMNPCWWCKQSPPRLIVLVFVLFTIIALQDKSAARRLNFTIAQFILIEKTRIKKSISLLRKTHHLDGTPLYLLD